MYDDEEIDVDELDALRHPNGEFELETYFTMAQEIRDEDSYV